MVLCWTLGGATLSPLPAPPPPGVRTCRLTPVLCNASKLTEDDGKVHVDTGEVQLYDPLKRKNIWGFFYLNVKIQNSQDHRDDDNKPVESNSSGSSSTWTFFGHFLSPQSLRKIHVRGRRPHRRTENCRHRYDQFGTESKGLSFKKEKKV